MVSAVPTVVDPLTRLAPADDYAGGSPPSPPRGRGLGISKIERFANVETLGLRFCRRIITLNVTPPSWRLQGRLEAGVTPIRWEIPRLCRGGSKSLTFSGVRAQGLGKDPSPVPRPLGKARGAVHPLPRERANAVLGALRRAMALSLSLGERANGVLGALRRAMAFSLSLGERANGVLGRYGARWRFPSPLGRGQMGCWGRCGARWRFPSPLGRGQMRCWGRYGARWLFPSPLGRGWPRDEVG